MEFGKIITKESYYRSKRTTKETWYQVPVIVKDKSSALSEILKSLELISSGKTTRLNIRIEADDKFRLKMLTKEYEVKE